jgi:chloramphenicol-sensitive protein RarD
MKLTKFSKGIISSSSGSFFWGFLGTVYFQYISFIGVFEIVAHRSFWTCVILLITTSLFKKWKLFKKSLYNKKNILVLFITSLLIFGNWSVWIYAVSANKIIDASFGYFIFPIISVFFGYLFLNEKLNLKRIISISLVIISTIYLFLKFSSLPWVGFSVAILWSLYNLLRKKINVETDIGLLIESLFILPIILVIFYLTISTNQNNFVFSDIGLMGIIFLAGPMTVIPLFMYVKGVELAGLGASGMVFFITPTAQFLLGFFYFNEPFSNEKFISFILIWIAVFIYLKDLYEKDL